LLNLVRENKNQMLPNRCIILASGSSIRQGTEIGLWRFLDENVVFSLNDNISCEFFYPTVAVFGDWTCYRDRYDLFAEHPLVIGRHDMHIGSTIEGATPCPKHDSLILLKGSGKYHGAEGLNKGLYSSVLTGAFALNLALRLGFKQIFLLGFDCCAINGSTHWYDDTPEAGCFLDYEGKPYTGVGKNSSGEYNTSFYNNDDCQINLLWEPFSTEDAMIYNVSLGSRINVFKKIGYHSFFKILKEYPSSVNQEEVQKEIRQLLEPYNKLEK
jgi:hypothetical protein